MSEALLALGIGRVPHLAHRMRLRHQPLEIVHEPFAAVLRVLVVPPDMNRLFRADFLAVATEDAAELIDLEHERIAVALLVFAWYELDAVGRAHCRAETARDAFRLAGLGREHTMRATPPARDDLLLLRILRGHLLREEMVERHR